MKKRSKKLTLEDGRKSKEAQIEKYGGAEKYAQEMARRGLLGAKRKWGKKNKRIQITNAELERKIEEILS